MKTAFIILASTFCVLIMVALQSCGSESGPGCGDYYFDQDNNIHFRLVDNGGTNLLDITTQKFDYDTVKIYTEDWKTELYPGAGGWDAPNGRISFTFIRKSDEGTINEPITHTYYIYLDYNHIDTLVFDFEMRLLRCGKPELSYLKVTHNDSVYFDKATSDPPTLEFLTE